MAAVRQAASYFRFSVSVVGGRDAPMTGEFVFALAHDTGQLAMTGRSAGPAGGAILTPAPGLDLLFDRCSGRLCRLTIDLPDVGRRRHDHEPGRQHMLVPL